MLLRLVSQTNLSQPCAAFRLAISVCLFFVDGSLILSSKINTSGSFVGRDVWQNTRRIRLFPYQSHLWSCSWSSVWKFRFRSNPTAVGRVVDSYWSFGDESCWRFSDCPAKGREQDVDRFCLHSDRGLLMFSTYSAIFVDKLTMACAIVIKRFLLS